MKYVSYIAFSAILLCCPVLRSQSVITPITLRDADVKFLNECGILQDDIKVIPNLPRLGQLKIWVTLHMEDRDCNDIQPFKDSREFFRKFTSRPKVIPLPPVGWNPAFLTSAELTYFRKVEGEVYPR